MSDARWADRHADLPPDLLADARAFIDHSDWRFAKTMPENPQWLRRGSGRA